MITIVLAIGAGLATLFGIAAFVSYLNKAREVKAIEKARAKDLVVDDKLRDLDTKRVDEAIRPKPEEQKPIVEAKKKHSIADELNRFNRGEK